MIKFFISLALVAIRQQANASGAPDGLFHGRKSSLANGTPHGISSDFMNSRINNIAASDVLAMKVNDAISNAVSNANNAAGAMTTVDLMYRSESVLTSATTAAQTVLNNVASVAVSTKHLHRSTAEPMTVKEIVSSAENAASNAISDTTGSSTPLSEAISNAVMSAASSSNFLNRIVSMISRMTTTFMTFIMNANSNNVVSALQESFASSLKAIRQSINSINRH